MKTRKIKKILIANRGEIALRIKRACDSLGIACACVLSEVDAKSSFASQFKEQIVVGPAPAAQSYLNQEAIIQAAVDSKSDAIHPGYGFLSENAQFAKKVRDAGLVFIGPSPESIEALGDKTRARAAVTAKGVPCVPGSGGGLCDDDLVKCAKKIGYPVIIKAAAGGGGRGMRVANTEQEILEALPRARAEAKKFFSNDDVFIEKFILNPRHVEVQIIGDQQGTVLHLGTRDCSSQRRHQKVIEEAPAPNLSLKTREAIHAAAVNAAKSVGYYNAGTAEFLVSEDAFYFLEMNTRIQVEHPVTEEVTGLDLVAMQIHVAEGKKLPLSQKEVAFTGHAVELRIYAEDPLEDFRPSLGKITGLRFAPVAFPVRKEFGFQEGDEISPHYDAMLGKIIVSGKTRLESVDNARRALRAFTVSGIGTNVLFLDWLLVQEKFREGAFSIQDIEKTFNREALAAHTRRDKKDPRHRTMGSGDEYREIANYTSEQFKIQYQIEVLHRFDNTFVAVPVLSNRKVSNPKFMRRSNSFALAVDSLCKDVLDKIEPEKLFT